ncbi:MAG: enoyl-CoA hydratase/isomerase family protein [Hyphomicrobiales bacterium]|nr:enoyl-CoA hydratase/isomerase family protein [Hyphomicrobiales bacterium]
MTNIRIDTDTDGIVTLTWDMPDRSMNVLSAASIAEYKAAVDQALADPAVKGVVVTSGKPAFIAGADLSMMESNSAAARAMTKEQALAANYERMMALNDLFRRIEKGGKPFVAAINGTALGGGLEVCLACHYRIAADDPKTQLGLPESKVGLMPGAGGTQRLPRLMGIQAALPLILEGRSLDPQKAVKGGMIHKAVPADQLIAEAKAWIKGGGKAEQPWDRKDFKIPGGGPYQGAAAQVFIAGNAMLRAKTYGNYPAQDAIIKAVYEGMIVPIDAALRIEARYMAQVMADPTSRNMIRSLFINMQKAQKGAGRPKDVPPAKLKTVGVLGAGMMGAGIAYVSAAAGLDVVLIDQSQEAADRGKGYSEKLLARAIEKGRGTAAEKDALLSRITATTSYEGLSKADLVIEAVFEDRTVKADVTRRAAAVMPAHAVFASNTSTLPITGLAAAWRDPATFIGIHFFSPVDKMQLVEIIKGKESSPLALATAMDYVRRIRKTPIVVNDSRGFYTSRCFGTYTREGMRMLVEGISPALIENAGKMTGMPMPPLALTDEVALDLVYKVGKQTQKDLGDRFVPSGIEDLIEKMVVELGRLGKKAGKGFYEYPADGKKHLWAGLAKIAPPKADQPDVAELKKRLLYIQAIEAARCFEEKVVTDPADADIGAILGWGFAPYTGGPLSLIDTVGAAEFVRECDRMAQAYGPRFAPNALLREMATSGGTFYRASEAA